MHQRNGRLHAPTKTFPLKPVYISHGDADRFQHQNCEESVLQLHVYACAIHCIHYNSYMLMLTICIHAAQVSLCSMYGRQSQRTGVDSKGIGNMPSGFLLERFREVQFRELQTLNAQKWNPVLSSTQK